MCRTSRASASPKPRSWPICASENPWFFESMMRSVSSASAAAIVSATSLTSTIWSRNHGSIFVAPNSCSTVAPLRSACCTSTMRPSVGTRDASTSSSALRSSVPQWNDEPRFSSERSAFCSAVAKLRPIAIASPTDFMVVVSVGSAAGNFSNANRGTFTTT